MLESKNKLGEQNNIWGVWCGAIPSRIPAWICFSFTSTPAQQPYGFKNNYVQFYRLGSGALHSVKIIVICVRRLPMQPEHLLLRLLSHSAFRKCIAPPPSFFYLFTTRSAFCLLNFILFFGISLLLACGVTVQNVYLL